MADLSDPSSHREEQQRKDLKKRQSRRQVLLLILFMMVATVAGVAFYWFQLFQRDYERGMELRITESEQRLAFRQQEHLLQLEQQLHQLRQQQQAMNHLLEAWNNDQQHMRDLTHTVLRNAEQWQIQEAAFLINLAHSRLAMGEELPLVTNMLVNAETILLKLSDPDLSTVLTAVAADLAELRGYPVFDEQAVLEDLNALQAGVMDWPLWEPQWLAPDQPQDAHKEGVLPQLRQMMGDLFHVRKRGSFDPDILSPQQQVYLRQHVQMVLMQAEIAVLKRDPTLYQQKLKQAHAWLARFIEPASRDEVLAQFAPLQALRLQKPDLSLARSREAMADYIREHEPKLRTDLDSFREPSGGQERA